MGQPQGKGLWQRLELHTQKPTAGLPMKRSSTQCLPVTPPAAPRGTQTGSLALWQQEHHKTLVTCISATTAGCPKSLQFCGLPAGGVPQPMVTTPHSRPGPPSICPTLKVDLAAGSVLVLFLALYLLSFLFLSQHDASKETLPHLLATCVVRETKNQK